MHHTLPLITTIAMAFALALVMGFIAVRFKLPTLVGYLLAGVAIGPFTPGFVANVKISQELAEIGVMLLMFGVGLHFSLADLLKVKKIAIPGAITQMVAATLLGGAAALGWGWNYGSALIFGISLSVASTVVLLRALEERGVLHSRNGHIAVGWLLVEDLAMVIVLVLLPPLAEILRGSVPSNQSQPLIWVLGLTLLKVSAFIALMLVVGKRLFSKILWQIARTGSRELFTLSVIAAAVSIAYGAAKLFGVSFALGAFFAGMVIRESSFSARAAEHSLPFRDAFAVLFFVSVGMLFNPEILVTKPFQVLLVVLVIIVGKALAAFIIVLAFRYPLHSALIISASLAQIGEFSFILAELGIRLKVLPEEGRSFVLAGALISIALNPLLFEVIWPLQRLARLSPSKIFIPFFIRSKLQRKAMPELKLEPEGEDRVILAGYDELGQHLAQLLIEESIPYLIVDDRLGFIEQLQDSSVAAIYGKISSPLTIGQANVQQASLLVILSSLTLRELKKAIRLAYQLNPKIEIIVRAKSQKEATQLKKETKVKVFLAEEEMAKNMGGYVLKRYEKSLDE